MQNDSGATSTIPILQSSAGHRLDMGMSAFRPGPMFNRPFEKRTAPSATPKRLLGISCIKNRLSQTTEATLGDGENAGQWARAGKKPRYPVSLRSLRCHVIDVAVASRRIQDVPMNRCALCAPPLEIFGNVYLP